VRYRATQFTSDGRPGPSSLRALGSPEVRDAVGLPLTALNSQPKRLALLTFLAIGKPEGCRRDTLLGLFWPELPESRARNALRQALAMLRGALGPDTITGNREDLVVVSPAHLETDAVRFKRLLDEGDVVEALALYRGDFVEGLFVEGCPELDRWIEEQRRHFRQRAAEAAQRAASLAERAGHSTAAVELSVRAVAISPFEEERWRARIALLGRLGRRAEALQCVEDLRALLERELGVGPDRETERLVEQLRYDSPPSPIRASAGSAPVAAPASPPPAPASPAETHAPPAAGWSWRRWLLLGAVSGSVAFTLWPRAGPGTRLDQRLVAIEPFAVLATDTTLLPFGDALAQVVALRFTGEAGPRAVDPALVEACWRKDSSRALPSTLDRARALGAGRALRATLVESGTHLILSGALLSVADGAVIAEGAAEGPEDSLLALVDQFVGQVLGRQAHSGEAFLQDLVTHSPAALRAYLAGLHAYRRGRYNEAVQWFDTAIERDSSFALAALQATFASFWGGSARGGEVNIAWAHRERLPPALRAAVDMFAPSHTWQGGYQSWEAGVAALPLEPFVWQRLGDQLYHEGGFLEINAPARSRAALERAASLDTLLITPLIHLVDWAARTGDASGVERLGRRYLSRDSVGEQADYIRWRIETAGFAASKAGLVWETLGRISLREIIGTAVIDGQGLDSLTRLTVLMRARLMALAPENREAGLAQLYFVALSRGRSEDAALLSREILELQRAEARRKGGDAPVLNPYVQVLSALFGGGSRSLAERSLGTLVRAGAAPPGPDPGGRMMQGYAASALALWFTHEGATDRASAWIARAESIASWPQPPLGQATIAASLAIARAVPGDTAALERLDSLVRTGPLGNLMTEAGAALHLSDLRAAAGDLARARDALRHRRYYQVLPVYISAFLERERRLATALGDTAAANRAARHLAALQHGPQPPVRGSN
jgi:DNA-binding SARP family transcriptional activator